jgi:hypothetical protein
VNPDIKEQWVGALRSGGYKQGRRRLADNDGKFCCLGVLCELATEAGVLDKETSDQFGPIYRSTSDPGDWDRNILPQAVVDWAELESPRPMVALGADSTLVSPMGSLDFLNDTGKKFDEIAGLIEASL